MNKPCVCYRPGLAFKMVRWVIHLNIKLNFASESLYNNEDLYLERASLGKIVSENSLCLNDVLSNCEGSRWAMSSYRTARGQTIQNITH